MWISGAVVPCGIRAGVLRLCRFGGEGRGGEGRGGGGEERGDSGCD